MLRRGREVSVMDWIGRRVFRFLEVDVSIICYLVFFKFWSGLNR